MLISMLTSQVNDLFHKVATLSAQLNTHIKTCNSKLLLSSLPDTSVSIKELQSELRSLSSRVDSLSSNHHRVARNHSSRLPNTSYNAYIWDKSGLSEVSSISHLIKGIFSWDFPAFEVRLFKFNSLGKVFKVSVDTDHSAFHLAWSKGVRSDIGISLHDSMPSASSKSPRSTYKSILKQHKSVANTDLASPKCTLASHGNLAPTSPSVASSISVTPSVPPVASPAAVTPSVPPVAPPFIVTPSVPWTASLCTLPTSNLQSSSKSASVPYSALPTCVHQSHLSPELASQPVLPCVPSHSALTHDPPPSNEHTPSVLLDPVDLVKQTSSQTPYNPSSILLSDSSSTVIDSCSTLISDPLTSVESVSEPVSCPALTPVPSSLASSKPVSNLPMSSDPATVTPVKSKLDFAGCSQAPESAPPISPFLSPTLPPLAPSQGRETLLPLD